MNLHILTSWRRSYINEYGNNLQKHVNHKNKSISDMNTLPSIGKKDIKRFHPTWLNIISLITQILPLLKFQFYQNTLLWHNQEFPLYVNLSLKQSAGPYDESRDRVSLSQLWASPLVLLLQLNLQQYWRSERGWYELETYNKLVMKIFLHPVTFFNILKYSHVYSSIFQNSNHHQHLRKNKKC